MKRIIFKPRGVGCSTLSVPGNEFLFQLKYLVLYVPSALSNIGGEFNPPVLIGQVSFVECQKLLMKKLAKPLNTPVVPQRLSDVIDHEAGILTARIWDEKDSVYRRNFGSNIDQVSVWVLPNGMELCFNQNSLPLPDSPTYTLFSAMTSNMLWNDRETFVQWLIKQRLHRDMGRLAAWGYLPTKRSDVAIQQ